MRILAKWLLSALGLIATAYIVPGVEVASFYTALVLAALLGLVNVFIRPLLIFLTLPINILTLGLFIFVINGFLFWLLSTMVKGFSVDGFGAALLGAIIVSIFSWIANQFLIPSKIPSAQS